MPVLRAAAFQECGDEGVRQVIGRRFALYPQPDRSDEEWAAWWADYLDVLGQVSWAALEAAMMSWVSNPASEFMPKPGKLLELSRTTPNKAAKRYERCRKAVDWVGNRPLPPIAYHGDHLEDYAPAPAADKEAVAKMLAEFKASVAKDRPVRGEDKLPSIAGKTDETGITPEMRAILARREDGGL